MSIFSDLANALGPYVGGSTVAGILLGSALTVTLLVALHWLIGSERGGSMLFIVSLGLGIVISAMVGWFPLWVPIFIALIIAFVIVRPFAEGTGG